MQKRHPAGSDQAQLKMWGSAGVKNTTRALRPHCTQQTAGILQDSAAGAAPPAGARCDRRCGRAGRSASNAQLGGALCWRREGVRHAQCLVICSTFVPRCISSFVAFPSTAAPLPCVPLAPQPSRLHLVPLIPPVHPAARQSTLLPFLPTKTPNTRPPALQLPSWRRMREAAPDLR